MLSFEILPKKNIDIDAWRFVKDQVMGGKSDGYMALIESANELMQLAWPLSWL